MEAFARIAALAGMMLASVTTLYADVYGSNSAVVRDKNGAALSGVTVISRVQCCREAATL